MSEYCNRHDRFASACPLSNLSPVFGPSSKSNKKAITQQREKRLPISYLALILRYINKPHTQSRVEKSLIQCGVDEGPIGGRCICGWKNI